MRSNFLTDTLARQGAELKSLLEDTLARQTAEIEAEVEARTANILAELQGLSELATKRGRASKSAPIAEAVVTKPVSSASAKGAKRSPGELEATTQVLLRYITKHPGLRIEKIAEALGQSTKALSLPVRKLIADKSISTRGQKRATTYSAR